MTQNVTEPMDSLTQEEVREAETAEQDALNKSQSAYLLRRVVVLRAQLNRVQKENEVLLKQLLEVRKAHEAAKTSDDAQVNTE